MAWCYRSVGAREEGVTVIDTEVRVEAQVLPGAGGEQAVKRRLESTPTERGQKRNLLWGREPGQGRTQLSCQGSQGGGDFQERGNQPPGDVCEGREDS